jgi:serine/threonine-protein kinase
MHRTPAQVPSLRSLLEETLDLEPLEREAFLARLRATHPERAVELERLLAAEADLDASRFLLVPSWSEDGPVLPGLAGLRLGAYTLERLLGKGGMGTVWLGRRSDGRYEATAAVKLFNLALLDAVGAERFRREGTLLARLSHPHIARLLDAGVTDGGLPYLVLEHVTGTRIDHYCDERRLAPEARLRLMLDVLGAVAHAHANLIVHRDLKPSNILVTDDGVVKLLDFGIAKLLEAERAGEATTLTDVGGRALTPEYAAPEQVSGGVITTATDVYALGVLLFVLLAGRHPIADDGGAAARLRAVLEDEPHRLSSVLRAEAASKRGTSPERLRRLYAGDLGNIVAKTLRKDPAERYGTVGALAEDIRRYLAHEPVRARPDSWRYRAAKFVRRNRAAVAVGILAALALVAAVARERHLRALAETETRKAGAVEEFLIGVFAAADPFAPARGHPRALTTRSQLEGGEGRVDTLLTTQAEIRTDLRAALGRVYASVGSYDKAVAQLRQALDERRALYGPRHPEVAVVLDALGQALGKQGRFTEAESLLREAVSQRRELHGSRSLATAQSLDHLAMLLRERGDAAAAAPLSREVEAIRGSTTRSTMLYQQAGQVWIMDDAGNNRVQLTRSGTNYSPTWAPGGERILFAAAAGAAPGIYSVNPDGSAPEQVTRPPDGAKDYTPVSIGERIGFTRHLADGTSRIFSVNPDGSGLLPLTPGPHDGSFGASPTADRLAFVSTTTAGGRDIFLLDLDSGRITRLTNTPTLYKEGIAFSPDGQRIAFTRIDPGQLEAIFVMNADGTGVTRVSQGGHYDFLPRWSPDGKRIGFTSGRDGSFGVYAMAPDGSDVVDLSQSPLQHESLWGWLKY